MSIKNRLQKEFQDMLDGKGFRPRSTALKDVSKLIKEQKINIFSLSEVKNLINVIELPIIAFNKQGKLVFGNSAFERYAELSVQVCYGLKFGDIFQCNKDPITDCGEGDACHKCLVKNSFDEVLLEKSSADFYFSLLNIKSRSFQCRVKISRLDSSSGSYLVCTLMDQDVNERHKMLERIFLHDVKNIISPLSGFASMLKDELGQLDLTNMQQKMLDLVFTNTQKILDEILAYEEMVSIDKDLFQVKVVELSVQQVVNNAIALLSSDSISFKHYIDSDADSIRSDGVLFSRVIINLLKNAKEASRPGDTIDIIAFRERDSICIQVKNSSFIPYEVQDMIFKNTVSTKGEGRGKGSYSVKLITEKYLQGEVSFFSSEDDGTTFQIILPEDIPQEQAA